MDEKCAQLWTKVSAALKPQVSADTFKRWFSAVKLTSATAETKVIGDYANAQGFKNGSGVLLSGGMIMNVIRYASLQTIARGEQVLRQQDLLDGIRREYAKENRLE